MIKKMLNSVPFIIVSLTDMTMHYVDPSNYDSVENVLKKFTKKINEKYLRTEEIIGEGKLVYIHYSFCYVFLKIAFILAICILIDDLET